MSIPTVTITPLTKKQTLYSDLRKDLEINPITKDLALRRDEDAVKESIVNLVLTNRGERLFRPNMGGGIQNMLFENNTPATLKLIQESVKDTINTYEPRASLIDVETYSNYNETTVTVNVIFYVRNRQEPVSVSVFLERLR